MRCLPRPGGFTLLEIIITLVILGLVAVMGTSFFTSGVTRTDVAIKQLQVDAKLQFVLENMIQDAKASYSNNLSGFAAKLNNSVDASSGLSAEYGEGNYYYIENINFVCPNKTTYTFESVANANQFLLITIKPNMSSGVRLTYIFNANNSTVCGN
jgi:prepilin-type N-terminal cleavage/methylation domain-containing protein